MSDSVWPFVPAALAIELAFLVAASQMGSLGNRHPPAVQDSAPFLEAEIFRPKDAHLTETKASVSPPRKRETVLSKRPGIGRNAKPGEEKEENQTQAGPALAPSHGPVAIYSPSPIIPPYLRNQELHSSAVIEFNIAASGELAARLVASSGNEELDAIAIRTAKTWRFHPAERDHVPIESKIRLRIVFEIQ